MQIDKNDISAVYLAIKELSNKYGDIPNDRANAAINTFLDALFGEGNWEFTESEFVPIGEKEFSLEDFKKNYNKNKGAKNMDFANVKTIEELLKLAATKTAIDPKYDERLLTKEEKPLAKSEAEESAFQSSESAKGYKGDLEQAMKGKEDVAKNRLQQIEQEERDKWNEGTFEPLKPEDYTY
jgi:hypothetical protein